MIIKLSCKRWMKNKIIKFFCLVSVISLSLENQGQLFSVLLVCVESNLFSLILIKLSLLVNKVYS